MIERVKKYSEIFEDDNSEPNPLTNDQIKFLDLHCRQGSSWKYNKETGKVDIEGTFDATDYSLYDLEGIEFGVVSGSFMIAENNLTTLKGCPEVVGKKFTCRENKKLESLEFGPKKVGVDYYCSGCSLESLSGSPEVIEGDFVFSNNLITSLKGGPRTVKGSFIGRLNGLYSLDGSPDIVGGDFALSQNNIESLAGCTKDIGGDFIMNANNLISLEGGPKSNESMKYLIASNSNLKSLKGCPEETSDFDASECGLESLEGAPREVNGSFNVSINNLKSLEGSPDKVLGMYDCSFNDIKDVTGISRYIEGNLEIEDNPIESLKGFDYTDPNFRLPKTIYISDLDGYKENHKGELLTRIAKFCYAHQSPWEQGVLKKWDEMTDEERARIYKQVEDLISGEDLKYYKAMGKYLNLKNLL